MPETLPNNRKIQFHDDLGLEIKDVDGFGRGDDDEDYRRSRDSRREHSLPPSRRAEGRGGSGGGGGAGRDARDRLDARDARDARDRINDRSRDREYRREDRERRREEMRRNYDQRREEYERRSRGDYDRDRDRDYDDRSRREDRERYEDRRDDRYERKDERRRDDYDARDDRRERRRSPSPKEAFGSWGGVRSGTAQQEIAELELEQMEKAERDIDRENAKLEKRLNEIDLELSGIRKEKAISPPPSRRQRDRTHSPPPSQRHERERTHSPPPSQRRNRDRTHSPPPSQIKKEYQKERRHSGEEELRDFKSGNDKPFSSAPLKKGMGLTEADGTPFSIKQERKSIFQDPPTHSAFTEKWKDKKRGTRFASEHVDNKAKYTSEADDLIAEMERRKRKEQQTGTKIEFNPHDEMERSKANMYARDWDRHKKQQKQKELENFKKFEDQMNKAFGAAKRLAGVESEKESGEDTESSDDNSRTESRASSRSSSVSRSYSSGSSGAGSSSSSGSESGSESDGSGGRRKKRKKKTKAPANVYPTFPGKPNYVDKDRPDLEGLDLDLTEEEEKMIWAFQHGVFGKGRGYRGKFRGGTAKNSRVGEKDYVAPFVKPNPGELCQKPGFNFPGGPGPEFNGRPFNPFKGPPMVGGPPRGMMRGGPPRGMPPFPPRGGPPMPMRGGPPMPMRGRGDFTSRGGGMRGGYVPRPEGPPPLDESAFKQPKIPKEEQKYEGSGRNHIKGKEKYFPGKYGFAADDSDDSDEEKRRPPVPESSVVNLPRKGNESYVGSRGRYRPKSNQFSGYVPGRKLENEGPDPDNEWSKLGSEAVKKIREEHNLAHGEDTTGRDSPNYNIRQNDDGPVDPKDQKPWWEMDQFSSAMASKAESVAGSEWSSRNLEGQDVFQHQHHPGFKPMPTSKFHSSFEPAQAIHPRQINVNIKSKFNTDNTSLSEIPIPEGKPTEHNSVDLNVDSLKEELMAKFRKEMEAKFQEEVKQKEVKKEIKEEFKKHQDYDRALQEQHEAAEREESAPIDPTQQAEKSRREKSSSNAQSQNANFNSKSNSTPSADDEASKAYLKQLQKWIQENAKSGEQAWQMFWDAFQQQQKSAGNWDDNDQELINHHQTTAYWWFGQAFNETKFDESGTTASQSSTVKKESKKVRVKQEAVAEELHQKRSHEPDSRPEISSKKIKSETKAKKSKKSKPDHPEPAAVNTKLASLGNLLLETKKIKENKPAENTLAQQPQTLIPAQQLLAQHQQQQQVLGHVQSASTAMINPAATPAQQAAHAALMHQQIQQQALAHMQQQMGLVNPLGQMAQPHLQQPQAQQPNLHPSQQYLTPQQEMMLRHHGQR